MWFQIELPTSVAPDRNPIHVVGGCRRPRRRAARLTAPRGYQVQVSADGRTWSAPVAEGQATEGTTIITFAPVRAKFVRITQTATVSDAPPWSMRLLRLYESRRGPR